MSNRNKQMTFLGWSRVAQKNEKTPLVDRALNLLLKKQKEKEKRKPNNGHMVTPLSRVKNLLSF